MFSIITGEKIKTHTIYLVAKKIALSDKNSYLTMLFITLIMPWCFLTGCLYSYLFIYLVYIVNGNHELPQLVIIVAS
jgi:hypothetical protein